MAETHLPFWRFLAHSYCCNHTLTTPLFSSLNKHMSRFCKVGNGGRISLWEGPAGPHSLNACSPDVCLSLILLKESACFLTGLCWADEENGPPHPLLPLTSLILTQDLYIKLHNLSLPSGHDEARVDRRSNYCNDTPHAALLLLPSVLVGNLSLQFLRGGLCAQLGLKNIFVI